MIQKYGWPLICCVLILGSCRLAHSDPPAPGTNNHRQEVRDSLGQLQSSLDQLLATQQLTADQHKTLSERVRQLQLQMHVDAQAEGSMSEVDRNTQFSLIDQIKQQAARLAAANRASVPVSSSSVPVSSASVSVNTSSAPVSSSSAPATSPSH